MSRRAYFDTGIIAKWYVAEHTSPEALELRAQFRSPSFLTELHRLELSAAWHAKVFRHELTVAQADQALADLSADIALGLRLAPPYDLGAVFARAETLARTHSASLGTRALDTLHVSAALALGDALFVTGDRRQAALATATGLRVTLIS